MIRPEELKYIRAEVEYAKLMGSRLPLPFVEMMLQMMEENQEPGINTDKVNRLEVVDNSGRAYQAFDIESLTLHNQDDGQTLKIFVQRTHEWEKE